MIVNYKYNFAYIGMTKTASESLHSLFGRVPGSINPQKKLGREKIYRHHGRIVPPNINSPDIILSIRNPYDRLISIYNMVNRYDRKKIDYMVPQGSLNILLDFMLEILEKDTSEDTYDYNYRWLPIWKYIEPLPNIKYLIKFETLGQDIGALPFISNNLNMPHLNYHPKKFKLNEIIDQEILEKANLWAGKDFELFGYNKSEHKEKFS